MGIKGKVNLCSEDDGQFFCEKLLARGGFCPAGENSFTLACVRDRKGAVWQGHTSKVLPAKLRSRKAEPWIARPQTRRRWGWGNALIIFIIILSFFGCSQSAPEVVRTECTVVFSYEDENSLPDARLSVFLQSESDVRRCERIKVHSVDAKYLWETNKIKKIGSDTFQWAGNANFAVPEGEQIPGGNYEVTYVHADDEQQVSYYNMKYDANFYDMKAGQVAEYMKNRGTKKFAIYDSMDVLLFLGEPSEEFSTAADMLDRYGDASYYKDVWIASDNSVICILPKRQL